MDKIKLPCGHTVTREWLMSNAAGIAGSTRGKPKGGNRGGGRPKKLVTCGKCGASNGTVAMRGHKCGVVS